MAITISDTEPRVQYTATSGQTSFSVPFEFFTVSDIKVFNGSTQLSYNASPSSASQYSVTGAAVSGGGSITLGGGATLNDVITIYRDLAVARSTDFPTSGAFQIDSLNTELDKIIAMIQQVERDLKFSPKAAATTANTFNITFPNLAANKVLSVNSSGNGLEFVQDITDIQTIAGIASAISNVSSISTAVSGVHSNATNINLVATNIGSVNAVAADIAKVVAVANDLAEAVSEVETVADDLNETTSEIEVVANNIANVNIVGGIDSSVTAVASKATEIGLLGVSGVITDMGILGTSGNVTAMGHLGTSANVTAMGILGTSNVVTDLGILGTSANVTAMGHLGTSSNVTAMGHLGTSANVTAMGHIGTSANVTAMSTLGTSTNVSNMATLAGISGLSNLASAHAAVSNVSSNLSAVQNFADVYRISSSAPTSSLNIGDLYFDTSANELKVYKSSGWAAAGSTVNGTSQRFTYTISGTPTTVSGADANGNTLAYDAGYADVYVNGVRMSAADITITSGTSVVFAAALANADVVDIVAYGTFNVASLNADNLDSGTVPIARLGASGTKNSTTFLRGDNTFATVTSVGGSTGFDLNDNVKARFGTDNDLEIFHSGGTNIINSNTSNQDIVFKGNDGGTPITVLTLDMSAAGEATFGNNVRVNDNSKIMAGTGNDLQISHDGNNSIINAAGTGDLLLQNNTNNKNVTIQSDDAAGGLTNYVKADGGDGNVLLYHYGNEKLKTVTDGIEVTGGIYVGGTGTANKLDDYEEGTWSPKLGNETTAVYSNQTGWYRKIGNTVYIYFSLSLSSKGDISGSYTKIANLPFNGISGGSRFGSGQIHAYRLSSSRHIQGIEFGGGTPSVGWIMTGGGSTTGYLNTSFVADNTYFEGFAMYRTG